MKLFSELLTEGKIKQKPFDKNPKIGWWLDQGKTLRFYHGTHIRNIDWVEKNGLLAPTEGSTAGWISLALEPHTAHGYAVSFYDISPTNGYRITIWIMSF